MVQCPRTISRSWTVISHSDLASNPALPPKSWSESNSNARDLVCQCCIPFQGNIPTCHCIPYPTSLLLSPDHIPAMFSELKMLCQIDKHGFRTGSSNRLGIVRKHIKKYLLNRGSTFTSACLQTNDYCLPGYKQT